MTSTTNLQPFMCTDTAKWDMIYEHDFIVNINNVTYTYCMDLTFMGYKRGECVGIKSLLPGQKLTQRHTASYSQIVFDETGKQVAVADSSSAETELIDAVSNNLSNVTNSSNTSNTSWNVSASAGIDLGMFGSYGASGGGSGTDTHTDFTETFESCITNSVSKVKNKKASSNISAFNSLHNTTTTNTTSSDSIDVIENLSNTKIAVYYFYTMYKLYHSRLYIKRAKTNWVMQSIVNMNPSIKRNMTLFAVPTIPTIPTIPVFAGKGVDFGSTIPNTPVFAGMGVDFCSTIPNTPVFAGKGVDFAGVTLNADYTTFKTLSAPYTAITTEEQKNAALAKATAENDIIKLRRNSVLPKMLMLPIDGFYITGENSQIVLDAFSK